MHAFLIISQSETEISKKIKNILAETNSQKYPFELSKIEHVRALEKFTKLSLNQKTAIVIKNFQNASEPAQNAFLKNLEEPQKNIIYVLTATSKNLILPTILSRCQIIPTNTQTKISKDVIEIAKNFFEANEIEKLSQTSNIKNREDAKDFLTKLIIGSHKLIKKNPQIALKLEVVQESLTRITKNGNPTLQLLNMCLNLN